MSTILHRTIRMLRSEQMLIALLAVVTGLAAGLGGIAFRHAIDLFQTVFFGSPTAKLASFAAGLAWWHVLLAPAVGGALIGLFRRWIVPGRRYQAVAEVIEAATLKGGRIRLRDGLAAAVGSAATLGMGGSAGREGPVVHLGATLASVIAQALGLRRSAAMTLLGCGVAAAIAASFNAPIAGVFFALEVVVGHYGLTAFAPVVLASIVGTIVTRVHFGDYPAFILDSHVIVSFWEIPAFALLGILCALVAWAFMASVFAVEDTVRHFRIPPVISPALGGLAVGAIAIALPEVLGVGYEATDLALQGKMAFSMLLALAIAKTLATALTLGSGFAGGVFSPSLFVGAMVGGAFGVLAAAAVPEGASEVSTYAIVGMASVAGAVLGAPISTILIVFELTANFNLTIAVMVGTALAALIANQVIGRSYFRWSLERRGIYLGADRARQMLKQRSVRDIMATAYVTLAADADRDAMRRELRQNPRGNFLVVDDEGLLAGVLTLEDMKVLLFGEEGDSAQQATAGALMHGSHAVLTPEDDLATALDRMEDCDDDFLPVVRSPDDRRIAGVVKQRDLNLAHNRALAEAGMEARGAS